LGFPIGILRRTKIFRRANTTDSSQFSDNVTEMTKNAKTVPWYQGRRTNQAFGSMQYLKRRNGRLYDKVPSHYHKALNPTDMRRSAACAMESEGEGIALSEVFGKVQWAS
jgi:hypothetical protein